MLEKPPPEKITCAEAASGAKTELLGDTWVAPTLVMLGLC